MIIRDFGYFSLPVLKEIIKQKAYIVSRLQTKIHIFQNDETQISFEKLYAWMKKNNITQLHKNVLIGKIDKIPVRLYAETVPEEIYQKRLQKIEKYNKKKGHKTSDDYKARIRFNLFITNVDEEKLPTEKIYSLYKLRWQIELIFKNLKSNIKIDKLRPVKFNRFMCILYAKLQLYVLNNQIFNMTRKTMYLKKNKLLSRDKCFKTLIADFEILRKLIKNKTQSVTKFINKTAKKMSKNHWLEKRKDRENFEEIFGLFI